jgi:hypothetical protein
MNAARRSHEPAFAVQRNAPASNFETANNVVTMHVGGPLDGVVTLTAIAAARVVVEARWGSGDRRDRISLAQPGEREALILADSWANQLIDGRAPTHDLRRRARWG